MSKRYLIVKIAAIGDVIMALPMVEEIRKLDKNADITWCCGKSVLPILENESIDHIISIDDKKIYSGTLFQKLSVMFQVWKSIGWKKYDVIAMGHADWRYRVLTLLARSEYYNMFSHKLGRKKPVPGRAHADEYVSLVNPQNKKRIHSVHYKNAKLNPVYKRVFAETANYVLLSPGGVRNKADGRWCRRWPIEKYVKLAEMLIDKNVRVIITGGPSDEWVNEYFGRLDVINLIGKTNLIDLIGIFSNVDAIITHDSGPMHLAGMTDTYLVALFGPTPPACFLPNRDNVTCLCKADELACCPCYDGKYYALCGENICMTKITVEEVFELLEERLFC